MNANNEVVTEQLIALLLQGNAHVTFDEAVKNIPFKVLSTKPDSLPYSIWQLVEHIRIAQWDILEFSKNPTHQSPKWPDEYWPTEAAPADEHVWHKSIQQVKLDRDEFIMLLTKPNSDLYSPFDHGNGQNLLREALLIADHTSYHTGQIILIRKLLSDWNPHEEK